MGMYTEIFVNVDLKQDTPDKVLAVLRAMCGENWGPLEGKPNRWNRLFSSGSYYTPNTCVAKLTFDEISGQWSLLGKGDIKNYESEIEQFFDWIMPFVDAEEGDFIGYHRFEESQVPTLILMSALPNV